MTQISALAQYQANTLSSGYGLTTRADKAGALGGIGARPAGAGKPNGQISGAGDTLDVSATAGTRAEVQAANDNSKVAQAGVTTVKTLQQALGKTQEILSQMREVTEQLVESPNMAAEERDALAAQMKDLRGRLDSLAEGEVFAGHKTLDGKFQVTFTIADEKVSVDATLPNGKAFNAEGLQVDGLAAYEGSQKPGSSSPFAALAYAKQDSAAIANASTAVALVDRGIGEAGESMLGVLGTSHSPFTAAPDTAMDTARALVASAQLSLSENAAAAFTSQANLAPSAVIRLLAS